MTTQEVANRYYELSQQNQFDAIATELYSNDIVTIEPVSDDPYAMQSTVGMEAKMAKDKAFGESIEEMHSGYCDAPIVSGNHFALKMGMECTMKGAGRVNMDELCMFEVKDGKIIKEQFFY